jgi:YkoY family integral membrane protein
LFEVRFNDGASLNGRSRLRFLHDRVAGAARGLSAPTTRSSWRSWSWGSREASSASPPYGIGGAFLFRILATLLAIHLLQLSWVKLVGAGYLLYLSWQHFFGHRHSSAEERRAIRPARPWLGLSAFWATVVKVELTDIIFAVDSILVAVAMSNKTWVIITGGILGIITMSMVIGKLLSLVLSYPALVDAAFIIIAWVGVKLLIDTARDRLGALRGEPMVVVRRDRPDLGVAYLRLRRGPVPESHEDEGGGACATSSRRPTRSSVCVCPRRR